MNFASATSGLIPRGVLAAVAVFVWASVGWASCGDYLHIQSPSADERPIPGPCSCQHGNCDAPAPLPPVGDPPTVQPNPPTDVLLINEADLSTSGSHSRSLDVDASPSITSSGIFHPPRG